MPAVGLPFAKPRNRSPVSILTAGPLHDEYMHRREPIQNLATRNNLPTPPYSGSRPPMRPQQHHQQQPREFGTPKEVRFPSYPHSPQLKHSIAETPKLRNKVRKKNSMSKWLPSADVLPWREDPPDLMNQSGETTGIQAIRRKLFREKYQVCVVAFVMIILVSIGFYLIVRIQLDRQFAQPNYSILFRATATLALRMDKNTRYFNLTSSPDRIRLNNVLCGGVRDATKNYRMNALVENCTITNLIPKNREVDLKLAVYLLQLSPQFKANEAKVIMEEIFDDLPGNCGLTSVMGAVSRRNYDWVRARLGEDVLQSEVINDLLVHPHLVCAHKWTWGSEPVRLPHKNCTVFIECRKVPSHQAILISCANGFGYNIESKSCVESYKLSNCAADITVINENNNKIPSEISSNADEGFT